MTTPTEPRGPGPYCYFFSYARENAKDDIYFDGFVEDLRKDIADNTGARINDVCFIDRNDIGLGEDWMKELGRGLKTSRSFVYLLSPAYLLSPYCMKEWVAFKARMHAAGEPASADARMFPVLWVARKRVEHLLPEPLKHLNDTSRGYPAEYGNQGVKWLRRMRGANEASDYDAFIRALSEKIADVDALPPPPPIVPDLQTLPAGWSVPDDAGAAPQPAAAGGASKEAAPGADAVAPPQAAAAERAAPARPAAAEGAPLPRAAMADGAPLGELEAAAAAPPQPVLAPPAAPPVVSPRAALFVYLSPQGPQWQPFTDDPRPVESLVYELAAREGVEYLPVDAREPLLGVAARAATRNHPLLVLVEGPRLAEREADLTALVAAATGGLLRGLVVLALWPPALRAAPGGEPNEAAWTRLMQASGGWAEATLDVVAGTGELSFKLPALLASTCLRLANADADARSVPIVQPFAKPVLVGPGGPR
ncbi:MAG TPA: TIR domain-containing protein [Longimicrobium sp.]|nr:TIR domain-containing protein [Longimicrobium sp.]